MPRNAMGAILDPSNNNGLTDRMIVDATRPPGDFPARCALDPAARARAQGLIGEGPGVTTEAFWAFSVAFYDRPRVSAAWLRLQHEHGADVNLILFALWCAARGCRLKPADLAQADAMVSPWREDVVRGIRQVHRTLRPPQRPPFDAVATEALCQQLLATEMAAERVQQDAQAMMGRFGARVVIWLCAAALLPTVARAQTCCKPPDVIQARDTWRADRDH